MSCLLLQLRHILISCFNYSGFPDIFLNLEAFNLSDWTLSDHKKFLLKSIIFKYWLVTFFLISDIKLSPLSLESNCHRVDNATYSSNCFPLKSQSPLQLSILIGLKLLVSSSGQYPNPFMLTRKIYSFHWSVITTGNK